MEHAIIALLMNLPQFKTEPTINVPGTNTKIVRGMSKKEVVLVFGAPSGRGFLHNGSTFIYRSKDICESFPGRSLACDVLFDDDGKVTGIGEVKAELVSPDLYD